MEGTFRSTIDMGRGTSSREFSKKYVSYIHQMADGQQRRLKKAVDTAPADNATPEPSYLNGVKIERKGRGRPPAEKKEQLWSTNGRREVQGKSHASSGPNLLAFSPTPFGDRPLTADEMRGVSVRKATGRFNQSSMAGSSMMVAEVEPTIRRMRARGENNPGLGISERMAKTLTHTAEPEDDNMRARRNLLWTVATTSMSTDSIIKQDSSPIPKPDKFAARQVTPNHRVVNLAESRSAFLGSLSSYAQNKVRGHYGDFTIRSSGGLASLAGY